MRKRRIGKKRLMITAIPVLTAGAVASVAAYQAGVGFNPKAADRNLQVNQVVFSDNKDTTGKDQQKNNDESELWQKNKDSQNEQSPQLNENADYLFENTQMAENTESTVGIISDDRNRAELNVNVLPDKVYDVSGNGEKGDTVIGTGGQNTGTNGNTSGNNGGNGTSDATLPNPGDQPTPDTGNTTRPSDTAKDPENGKFTPGGAWGEKDWNKPYTEDMTPNKDTKENGDNDSVIIEQPYGYTDEMLYEGQSVDQKTIFNALMTYVQGSDKKFYLWGADALNRYVRIDAVSFDGGISWQSGFPVTIPKGLEKGQMRIRASYRLSVSGEKWVGRIVDYVPANNRLFVLKEQIKKENATIDTSKLLNMDRQFQEEGTIINLFGYIDDLFRGQDTLTELSPGWTEDGKLVPWYYKVTAGRHILEPADMVPLSDDYTVKIEYVWMSDDYQVGNQYSNLCYLQTLKNYKGGGSYNTLDVPEYIQAIRIDDDTSLKVDKLSIPSTVLYIETTNSGLEVEDGYEVSKDNLFYSASDDGVLMNKAKTEMIGIPSKVKQIEIPDTVEKVVLPKANRLKTIRIDASTIEDFPEIDYANLKNCKVIVKEDLLNEFLQKESKYFNETTGNSIASEQDEDITYTLENDMIVDNNGWIRRVTQSGTSIKLAKKIRGIQEGAFENAGKVSILIMPENGDAVKLEKGCFTGSSLERILCYTKKQYEKMQAEIGKLEEAEYISVELLETSKEGYTYCSTNINRTQRNTLISVPEGITYYDGTVTSESGEPVAIHEIGAQAFADCDDLKWVELPKETDAIGYRAFANCSSMEGLLIDQQDTVTIGNQALDGCASLRFAASNAMHGVMEDGYAVLYSEDHGAGSDRFSYFYIPTNSDGYDGYCQNFTVESNVTGYAMTEIGGTMMLYGTNAEQGLWLGIRSGKTVDEKVNLPLTTVEIFQYAMANTMSETGKYTVNWEELTNCFALDDGAFYRSDLAGDLKLYGDNLFYLLTEALAYCPNITSVRIAADQTYLGQFIFEEDSALKTVEFNWTTAMAAGTFTGCDSLERIVFNSYTPITLCIFGNSGFQFNYSWTEEEETEKLSVQIPETAAVNYIKKWRYLFAGYYDLDGQSAYQCLWSDLESALTDWDTGRIPDEEEVDEFVEAVVLKYENRIRKMMGIAEAVDPTEFYPYRVDKNGNITLIGASSDIDYALLWGDEIGLPSGWTLDYIGKGAFKRCKNLQNVWIDSSLVGIYENAFEGVESDSLSIIFWGSTPPKLLGLTEGTPFDFGVEYDKISLVMLDEESKLEYLEAWKYPMARYEDKAHMKAAVYKELSADGTEPSDEEVEKEINKRLKPVEKQLRKMLDLPEAEDDEKPVQKEPKVAADPASDAVESDNSVTGKTEEDTSGKDNADSEKKEDASADRNDGDGSANEEIEPDQEQEEEPADKEEMKAEENEEDTEEK